ncbi:MAG: NYN domain-containing protein, partial [Thiobacillaceae bacterium]
CGASWPDYEEKMTDVNIAIQWLGDAFDNAFDTALVLSGDSDLTTPTCRVRERFAQKRIVVAFLPSRYSNELERCANGYLTIGEDKLRASQLPEQLVKPDGDKLTRPATWR